MSSKRHYTKNKWTPELIAELRKSYDADTPYPVMGEQFRVAPGSVHAIVARYYPDRKRRSSGNWQGGNKVVTPEIIERILAMYADGALHKEIAAEIGFSKTVVETQIRNLRLTRPDFFKEVRQGRREKLAKKGRNERGAINNFRLHNAVSVDERAYTALDAAIDYLRKFAPCHRDTRTGMVIYGNTQKTEEEIFAMVERKKRQAEAWKEGRL